MLGLIASLIGIIYLLLEYRASVWLWAVGFVMDALYCWIYLDGQFYANAGIYLYYMAVCLWGGWLWLRRRQREEAPTCAMPRRGWLWVGMATAVLTAGLTWLLGLLGESELALLDALTSAASIVGMVMMARGYYQQWVVWMVVNPIYVLFNLLAGLPWMALMFAVYSVVSVLGYRRWKKLSTHNTQRSTP